MKFLGTSLIVGASLLVAGVAIAQPGPGDRQGPRGNMEERRAAMVDRMFQRLDANGDGRITFEESFAHLTARFNAADADNSGHLTPEQFANFRLWEPREGRGPRGEGRQLEGWRAERAAEMRERRQARRAERQAAMFRALDANGNGQVTLEDMRPWAEARFRMADVNSDGAITREEVMQRMGNRGGYRHGHRHGGYGR